MGPAVLASLAVWLLVRGPARSRARRLFAAEPAERERDLVPVAGVLGALASVLLLGWPLGVVAACVVGPMVARVVRAAESGAERRRRADVERQLPGALDLVVAALDAGRPPVTAFTLAARAAPAPLGSELGLLAHRLEVCSDPRDVWAALRDDPFLAAVGRALMRAEASGIPAARVIAHVADEQRRRRAAELRRRSRTVAVSTAGPLGACFLPAFFLVGIVPTVAGAVGDLGF